MLLIPFAENALKYGVSSSKASEVGIDIWLSKGIFTLYTRNQIFSQGIDSTGIGIKNTRKRLESLYPNHYSLVCGEKDRFYESLLTLKL